jgi:hypothetical protein
MNGVTMPSEVPKDIPKSVSDAVDAAVRAAQQYGAAVGKDQPMSKCRALVAAQQEAVSQAFTLISAELKRRYEAGIEMGLQQAEHQAKK